ncbi:MAG: ABC transporter substrate-binding protein [Chloroflexi bacterium]|nr:ABC transporter substrate-binding protein [Chloroflexota bacterium]
MGSISRRQFLALAGTATTGLLLAACAGASSPVSTASASSTPAVNTASTSAGAASSSASASTASGASPTSIKISDIQITSAAGNYIALEKGYFKDEKVEVELVTVPTAEQITALLSGSVDVAGSVLNVQLYNAMARGVSFKMLADHGSNLKDASAGGVVIRKDLVDSGKFKGPADMKGLNVFHASPVNTADIALERYLKGGGLTLKDIQTSPVTNFPDVIPAFSNKAVDVAYFQEPFSTIAIGQNLAVRGPIGYDIYPNQQIATLVMNNKITGELAVRYLRAYTRGVRDYVKAFLQKDQAMFDQVVPILIKHTTVKDRALFEKAIPSGLKADPIPNVQGILDDFDWFVANGSVTQKYDLKPYIDTTAVQEAIKQLGPAS